MWRPSEWSKFWKTLRVSNLSPTLKSHILVELEVLSLLSRELFEEVSKKSDDDLSK